MAPPIQQAMAFSGALACWGWAMGIHHGVCRRVGVLLIHTPVRDEEEFIYVLVEAPVCRMAARKLGTRLLALVFRQETGVCQALLS